MNRRVRVLVVDDSAYNRRTIIKLLEAIPEVQVVGYAVNGEEGLRKVFDLEPDLITLDLEMPRMDGFSFLRVVMQNRPTPVIVVSARSDDENVFKALELGAVEFVAKPSLSVSPALFDIRDDLVRKVRLIARTDMKKILNRAPLPPRPPRALLQGSSRPSRPPVETAFDHVVIAASTGGPPALQAVLSAIKRPLPVSFAIAQHMPPGFTRAFAERLDKFCTLDIREARTGDVMRPGLVLVAPGARNLLLRRHGSEVVADVVEPDSNQRYVPSADVLFASASDIFGPRLLGVVLTGMGNDGARGTRAVKARGGTILAEAEETSVVFGMPKEAIATGQVDKVLPLQRMGDAILRYCGY